jgi:hypothetical protein
MTDLVSKDSPRSVADTVARFSEVAAPLGVIDALTDAAIA